MKLYLRKDGVAVAELSLAECKSIQTCLGIGERTIGHVQPLVGQIREQLHKLIIHWSKGETAVLGPGAAVGASGEESKQSSTPEAPYKPHHGNLVGPPMPKPTTGK